MWANLLLKTILFISLVPGVVVSLPTGGSLHEKAIVHGLVFAVVNYLVYIYIRPMLERFDNPDTRVIHECPPGYVHCGSGDCRLKTDVHSPCS